MVITSDRWEEELESRPTLIYFGELVIPLLVPLTSPILATVLSSSTVKLQQYRCPTYLYISTCFRKFWPTESVRDQTVELVILKSPAESDDKPNTSITTLKNSKTGESNNSTKLYIHLNQILELKNSEINKLKLISQKFAWNVSNLRILLSEFRAYFKLSDQKYRKITFYKSSQLNRKHFCKLL